MQASNAYPRAVRWVMFSLVIRPFRHGLAGAGLCFALALSLGLGGAAFASPARVASGTSQDAVSSSAASSLGALRTLGRLRWQQPAAVAVPHTSVAESGTAIADVDPSLLAAATTGSSTRIAQPLNIATPALRPGDRVLASVSFYYCADSGGGRPRGDGGGFCGTARDGSGVRSGVAACDVAYLGQRFRIEGDPTGRTYVCADTGSDVHGLHRDIWFRDSDQGWRWQQVTGRRTVIEVVE